MVAVSEQPEAFVQINLYVPALENVCMVVSGFVADEIVAVPALPVKALQVPAPVAVIVAEPPGSIAQLTV